MPMSTRQQALARLLTYLGAVPMLGACALAGFGIVPTALASHILITYAAIIIAFLAGIHWGVYLFFAGACPRNLLLTSNITALLAWAVLLMPQLSLALVLQLLCVAYLLLLDVKLHRASILPAWFFHLRRTASWLVIASLVSMFGLVSSSV